MNFDHQQDDTGKIVRFVDFAMAIGGTVLLAVSIVAFVFLSSGCGTGSFTLVTPYGDAVTDGETITITPTVPIVIPMK